MTYAVAAQTVANMTGGEHHALLYEETHPITGGVVAQCSVYADGRGWHKGGTWEQAINNLHLALYPDRKSPLFGENQRPQNDVNGRRCEDCAEMPADRSCTKCGDTINGTKDAFVRATGKET